MLPVDARTAAERALPLDAPIGVGLPSHPPATGGGEVVAVPRHLDGAGGQAVAPAVDASPSAAVSAAAAPVTAGWAVGEWRRSWRRATPAERAVAVAVVALGVASAPNTSIGPWPVEALVAVAVGLAGLPVLAATALGWGRAGRRDRWPAAAAVAWLAVALVSALRSDAPALSVVGLYGASAGWLLLASMAGWWALGTRVTGRGRQLVVSGLLVAAAVNAVVAVAQVTIGLSRLGFPTYGTGQAVGLQDNPVYLGGLEVGAVAIVAWRVWHRPSGWRLLALGALAALAAGASGERLALGLTVVIALAAAVASWHRVGRWRHATAGSAGGHGSAACSGLAGGSKPAGGPGLACGSRWLARRSTPPLDAAQARRFAGITVVAGLAGAVLPTVRHTGELATKLDTSAEGTFGDRLHAWLEGARALVHHPVLGFGPGRFEAATSSLFPLWFDRSHPGQVFTDAHDIVVELAVTTGLLGVGLFLVWVLAALRWRRGALVWCALAVLVVELVEPIDVVLAPLALLAIGAAEGATPLSARGALAGGVADRVGGRPVRWRPPTEGIIRRRRRVVGVASAVSGALGLLLGLALLVGSVALAVASQDVEVADHPGALTAASLANRLLAPWPESAEELATVQLLGRQAAPTAPTPLEIAVGWEQTAADRDPANAPVWATVAGMDLQLGRLAAARSDATVALRSEPWDVVALRILGDVALDQHRLGRAAHWFRRLVRAAPDLTVTELLHGVCQPGPLGVGHLGGPQARCP